MHVRFPRLTATALAFLVSLAPIRAETDVAEAAPEFTVVTYNVENLFDADGVAVFDDYAETEDENTYSPGHLLGKLQTIGRTLKTFNDGRGPEIIAFNEIEIDFTPDSTVGDYGAFFDKYKDTTVAEMLTSGLNDEVRGLPAEALLAKHLDDEGLGRYEVVIGADAPPVPGARPRAQKNVLFSRFPVLSTRSHDTLDARDILEVTLDAHGHPFHVFVNHWKSGASNAETERSRVVNAQTLRDRLEEIFLEDPNADVLLAGDFNSQYNQSQMYPFMEKTGVNDVLGSQGDELATATATNLSLYNLWHDLPPEERKSDIFQGNWGTLMQKMITPGLYDFRGVQYVDNSFSVVVLDGINAQTSLRVPKRWTNAAGGSGASDHFPIAARFRVVSDNDPERRKELVNPGTDDGSATPLRVGFENLKPGDVPAFGAETAENPGRHIGEVFLVSGEVTAEKPQAITVDGRDYLLWSRDASLRERVQQIPAGTKIEFLGEFGMHRGNWQFLIEQPSWLISAP